jgi:polyferredoxin
VEFLLFMRWVADPGHVAYAPHPAGAEGFLPISALLSLKYLLTTGILCEVHPAGLFIFVAILALGLFLKKAFCSWLCPVGTLGEVLWKLGTRLFGRSLALPRWLDVALRSLKYLLLLFFLGATLAMDGPATRAFLFSPFNVMADLSMYLFFARISAFALAVVLALAALSAVVQNFACRYLCPYGALLGLLSLFSPVKITRSEDSCIGCQACTFVCPSRIQVHEATRVANAECTGCYRCVEACPVKGTLEMRAFKGKAVPVGVFGALVVGLFVAVTGLAMVTGHWKNEIPRAEYQLAIHMLTRR